MRILILTNLFPPSVVGGYELHCAAIARALAERGHEIRVLTSWTHLPRPAPDPGWVERALHLNWFIPHLPGNPALAEREQHGAYCSAYENTAHLLRVLDAFQPEIVYAWNLIGLGAAALMDVLNQVEVPWALHLGDRIPTDIIRHAPGSVLGLFNAEGAELYRRARVLCISETLRDEIWQTSGIDFKERVEIVPGWAEPVAAQAHAPYLRGGQARFAVAGTIVAYKGIDLILEAAARLDAEGVSFLVDCYGDGDLPNYVDRAHALQLEHRVRFLGPRPHRELLALLGDYDALLFPTWDREPFGMVPIEAAARGTPPILTRLCGAAERLVDGVHCLKIDRTAEALAEAMAQVACGAVDLERMGRAARRLVAGDLSLERCVQRIEAILAAAARPWPHRAGLDPQLPLLAFLKHNLSVRLRFG